MDFKINLRKLSVISLYLLTILFIFLILNVISEMSYDEWLIIINILILSVLLIQLVFIKVLKYEFFSISVLFLLFSYVFHLSYQFLLLIDFDFGGMSYAIPTTRYGNDVYREAVEYSLKSIMMLFLGMMVLMPHHSKREIISVDNSDSNKFNKILGIILIIISLPVNVYILVIKIQGMIAGGYVGVIENSVGVLPSYLSNLLLPGVFLLLVSIKNNIKLVRLIAVAFIFYTFLGTFAGQRAYTILNIILFLYLYFNSIEKPKFKTIIYSVIAGYFTLSWFIVIRNNRAEGLSISSLFEIFNLENSVILNTFSELGFTINIVCITLSQEVNHIFGGQVLYSILTIIPKVSELFSEFNNYNIYNAFDLSRYGSSYIGDFNFDFGNVGIFISAIYGLIIQKLNNTIKRLLQEGKYFKVALILPLILELLFTVRSGTYKLLRIFIWTSMIILIIKLNLTLIWKGGKNNYANKKAR
ncbi:O-antigen polysaccharide polymerase Wzy [Metabacillus sediminilitoris]|uniref:O-antigen polysaccharide polymerase Wzy n=1 Tax=Metabacillus sediminilitoris TaxID=2567941 RepID=A0A4S4C2L7_9BACI|nr:O-antigen polysaccharide polymerase Wzy [Metabacillus sediminilitoris]QGQ48268.1 O-antigen polysaccharide polymerase Wzy [Metabacillus sediminilitoris]THF81374.1 O-antigen polysaccharide polymerase Wzy [Metabacillus sediminilitoris]